MGKARMANKFANILGTIGATPVVKLQRLAPPGVDPAFAAGPAEVAADEIEPPQLLEVPYLLGNRHQLVVFEMQKLQVLEISNFLGHRYQLVDVEIQIKVLNNK